MSEKTTKKGLGKGLSALLGPTAEQAIDRVTELPIEQVSPNRQQPRQRFDDEKLAQLAGSIEANGIITPLIVRRHKKDHYLIVAGERRWRAARQLGLKTLPVIIRELSELEEMEQSLIENIVREDLNPIEEAEAISRLLDGHGMTQEALSRALGRSRPALANALRLLTLDEGLKEHVREGRLTAGHARALLMVSDEEGRRQLAELVLARELSVRQTEELARSEGRKKEGRGLRRPPVSAATRRLEHLLEHTFGAKVKIQDREGRGSVTIRYASLDELDRLLERWGVPRD